MIIKKVIELRELTRMGAARSERAAFFRGHPHFPCFPCKKNRTALSKKFSSITSYSTSSTLRLKSSVLGAMVSEGAAFIRRIRFSR
jgi:hypothetical protein